MLTKEDFLYQSLINQEVEIKVGIDVFRGIIVFESQNTLLVKLINSSQIKSFLKSSIDEFNLIFTNKKINYNHELLMNSTLISRIKKFK